MPLAHSPWFLELYSKMTKSTWTFVLVSGVSFLTGAATVVTFQKLRSLITDRNSNCTNSQCEPTFNEGAGERSYAITNNSVITAILHLPDPTSNSKEPLEDWKRHLIVNETISMGLGNVFVEGIAPVSIPPHEESQTINHSGRKPFTERTVVSQMRTTGEEALIPSKETYDITSNGKMKQEQARNLGNGGEDRTASAAKACDVSPRAADNTMIVCNAVKHESRTGMPHRTPHVDSGLKRRNKRETGESSAVSAQSKEPGSEDVDRSSTVPYEKVEPLSSTSTNPSKVKKFLCVDCGRNFKTSNGYRDHRLMKHGVGSGARRARRRSRKRPVGRDEEGPIRGEGQ